MLTQFFKSINWVDVGLVIFFIRTVFASVKSGFIAEGFRFLGTMIGLFLSLHYYSFIAHVLARKTSLNPTFAEFLVFVVLWLSVALIFMFVYKGVLLLFKISANNQVIDKYAAGFLGASRAIFLLSLTIFALLLSQNTYLGHQTFKSYGYKLTAKAAPNTYSAFFNNFVSKVFVGQQFNDEVFAVISRHGINPKRNY